jgi:hypothetical protein
VEPRSRAVLHGQPEIIDLEVGNMSVVVMRAVRRGWAVTVPIVVVAAVLGVMLVVWATAGGTTSPPGPSSDPRGVVRDAAVNPWEANDPALLSKLDSTAGFASEYGGREVEWTQTGIGAVITQEDGSMIAVAAVENSADGPGAVVAEITLNGTSGTQRATRYTAKGVLVGEEEFTLGTPDAAGAVPFTGSGECVEGGTRAYKNAECSYTVTGTLDPTNVVTFEITGTTTR